MASGGTSSSNSKSESTTQRINAIINNLPNLVTAINSSYLPYAKGIQSATGELAPADVALNSKIAALQTGANTELLKGGGRDYIQALTQLDKETNPEYYGTRTATSNKLSELIGSYGLNGLSPAEETVAERALNKERVATGNLSNNSPIQTVRNAMVYGNEFDKKRAAVSNLIGTATNFMSGATRINPEQSVFQNPMTQAAMPKTSAKEDYASLLGGLVGMSPGSKSNSSSIQAGIGE